MKGLWHVMRCSSINTWHHVVGAAGQRGYATGWYHALTSFLPRPAYRLIDGDGVVREEDAARSGVQINNVLDVRKGDKE